MNSRDKRDLKRLLKILPILVIATWLILAVFECIPKVVHKIRKKHTELYNKAIDEKMDKLREEIATDNF